MEMYSFYYVIEVNLWLKYLCLEVTSQRQKSQRMTTYNKTCVTSKDSDQPLHPHSMAKFFAKFLWTAWRL